MSEFTPISALIGGCLIGLAAVAMMVFLGRIAGVSGVLSGMLARPALDWRAGFVIGLLLSGILASGAGSSEIVVTDQPLRLVLGGLAVGAGTVLGSGCTSGHGVCGLARFSRRSMVAVVVFMGVAVLTVLVTTSLGI